MFGGRMCHHGSTLIVPLPPLSYEEDDLKKSPPLRFLGLAMGMVRDKKQGEKRSYLRLVCAFPILWAYGHFFCAAYGHMEKKMG
ncbi:hypothetical protein ACFX12_016636 [Malus domestica]